MKTNVKLCLASYCASFVFPITVLLIWDVLVSAVFKHVICDMANPLKGEVIRLYKNVN